jgi:hypothetical protein
METTKNDCIYSVSIMGGFESILLDHATSKLHPKMPPARRAQKQARYANA